MMKHRMHKGKRHFPKIVSCCLVGLMSIQMLLPVSSAYEASRESKAYSAAKADLTRSADIKVEYHRINDVYDIKGGDTHVIFFEDSQHILYYDQHGQNNQTTDQVSGEADGDRLSLAEKFDASTQTWKLIPQPNGSYHIQSCSGENRYLNMDQVNGNTDKVPVGNTPQEMIIAAHDDGFSIKREDRYLHHEQENQFYVSNQPASFHIYKRIEVSTVKSELDALIAAVDTLRSDDFTDASVTEMRTQLALAREASKGADEAEMKRCTKDLRSAMQALEPKKELLAPTKPDPHTGMTQKEPFPRGISGNLAMRIPALITLNDGSLAAAIDARWDYCPDGEAIDTLFSISEDNGETWTYSYPNYFNDSTDYANSFASALIDPVMVQGKDDTLYLMVDVLPGGTPLIGQCADDTGYRKIGDKMRMVLYTMADGGQTDDNWSYYVGDFVDVDGKAYAPVIQRDAAADELNEKTDYWLDDHYYLYTADKKPMYCPQLGIKGGKPAQPGVERGESIKDNGKYVHESVFFYNAELHVRRATYLWLTTSDDNGKTWSAPTILNPQVRPEDHTKAQKAYIVGPGAGLCLDDGTIMLTCYTFSDQDASFIYKKPGENIWHRSDNATSGSDWSSESVLIQLNKDTVRHFYRDGVAELRYTDHTRNPDTGEWKAGTPVTLSGVVKATNNQLSALLYSKKINGKPVILVSTATVTTPRSAGRIYSFNVEENGDMTLLDTYHVNRVGPEPGQPDSYSYSSLTELDDGRIGLLYEDDKRRGHEHAAYVTFTMEELMPNHQMLDMRPGEQKVIQSTQGSISKDFDQNVIDVKVRPTVEIEGGQGRTGTTANLLIGVKSPLS